MPAQPETPEDDQGDSADEGENDKITPIRPAAQSRQGKDQYAAESGERTTPHSRLLDLYARSAAWTGGTEVLRRHMAGCAGALHRAAPPEKHLL
jgi:hypothetical protein